MPYQRCRPPNCTVLQARCNCHETRCTAALQHLETSFVFAILRVRVRAHASSPAYYQLQNVPVLEPRKKTTDALATEVCESAPGRTAWCVHHKLSPQHDLHPACSLAYLHLHLGSNRLSRMICCHARFKMHCAMVIPQAAAAKPGRGVVTNCDEHCNTVCQWARCCPHLARSPWSSKAPSLRARQAKSLLCAIPLH